MYRYQSSFEKLKWRDHGGLASMIVSAALSCAQAAPAHASGYSFAALNVPGSICTMPMGINDKGVIAGTWCDAGYGQHGFTYNLATKQFTTVDGPPSSYGTDLVGIDNKGRLAGYYFRTAGGVVNFLDVGRKFFPYAVQGGIYNGYSAGMNNNLQTTGFYATTQVIYGFAQAGRKESLFTDNGQNTSGEDLNDSGTIVGYDQVGQDQFGFIDANGSFTAVTYPGAQVTILQGINDAGAIVGSWSAVLSTTSAQHGFLYQNGAFTDLPDAPGALRTFPTRLNQAGVIVGYSAPDSGILYSGFILTPTP